MMIDPNMLSASQTSGLDLKQYYKRHDGISTTNVAVKDNNSNVYGKKSCNNNNKEYGAQNNNNVAAVETNGDEKTTPDKRRRKSFLKRFFGLFKKNKVSPLIAKMVINLHTFFIKIISSTQSYWEVSRENRNQVILHSELLTFPKF